MNKILSIIITYNASKWLDTCIGSLITSDLPTEIVVVDNASTDNTVALIKERYLDAITWFFPLNENLGFGKAHNYAFNNIPLKEYDFVFLLNQDASIQPDTIKQLVEVANQRPRYGVLSPMHYHQIGQREKGFNRYYTTLNKGKEAVNNMSVSKVEFVNAAIWLVRRGVIEKLHGFDPLHFHYGEDRTFVHRLRCLGYEVGIVEEAIAYHYRSQLASGLNRKKMYEQFKIMDMIAALRPEEKLLNTTGKILIRDIRIFVKACMKFDWEEAWGILGSFGALLRKVPAILRSRKAFFNENNLQ